jgi:hypothetical protein
MGAGTMQDGAGQTMLHKYVSISEAARLRGCSRGAIVGGITRGDLDVVEIEAVRGRWLRRSDVMRFVPLRRGWVLGKPRGTRRRHKPASSRA